MRTMSMFSRTYLKGTNEMAILKNIGKALGLASQGITDAAQTIKSAAQEARDDIARDREDRTIQKETGRKEEQERIAAQAHKCPNCGQQLKGISAICPLCGYEIRNAKTAKSINDLTKEINKLNQKRNVVADAFASKLSGSGKNPTDEKIASLIHNFIVPNSKEDIFEFMILAAGYMDAKFLAGKGKESDVADVVIKAWASKFSQTYQKAKLAFGQDSDFKMIQDLYEQKMREIEDAKRFSLFRR